MCGTTTMVFPRSARHRCLIAGRYLVDIASKLTDTFFCITMESAMTCSCRDQ